MQFVTIEGQVRESNKKKGAKEVRNSGMIPAVLYGGNENFIFSINFKEVKSLIFTPDFKLAKINIEGQEYKCFIKNIQFHPVTDDIMHIDFIELVDGHPIKVELPIRFTGVSPGVKEGGQLIQALRMVKVKTTPEHLVDQLIVDISNIKLGQSVRVRDLGEIPGVEIINSGASPIASVEVPRVLKEVDLEEEGELLVEEGEVEEETEA